MHIKMIEDLYQISDNIVSTETTVFKNIQLHLYAIKIILFLFISILSWLWKYMVEPPSLGFIKWLDRICLSFIWDSLCHFARRPNMSYQRKDYVIKRTCTSFRRERVQSKSILFSWWQLGSKMPLVLICEQRYQVGRWGAVGNREREEVVICTYKFNAWYIEVTQLTVVIII